MKCLPTYKGKRYNSIAEINKAIRSIKPSEFASKVNQEQSGSSFLIDEELNIFSMLNSVYLETIEKGKDQHTTFSEYKLRKLLVGETVRLVKNNPQYIITQEIKNKIKTDEQLDANEQAIVDRVTLVKRALEEVRDNDRFWQTFKIQLSSKYGIQIRDDEFNSINNSYLTKSWDDTISVDPIRTANDEIKRFINRTKIVDPNNYILNDDGIKVYQSNKSTPTGFPDTLNWNIHGTELFNVLNGAITDQDMLSKLQEYATYGNTPFAKTLFAIYDALKGNDNLRAAWYSVFDKAKLDSYRDLIKSNDQEHIINIDISNKGKAAYVLANNWQNDIITKAENYYFTPESMKTWETEFDELVSKTNNFSNRITLSQDNADELARLASKIGIVLNSSAILYVRDKRPATFYKEIISPILRIKGYTTEQKKEAYLDMILKNPNIKFNEYGNILRLANAVALFSEGITTYSNTNVKNNLINDIENHGFLTTLFRDIKSSDDNAYDRLIDYTKVLSNQQSFLLWGDRYTDQSKSGKPISIGKGFFDYYIDNNGLKIPLKKGLGINKENLNRFNLVKYEGSKDLTYGIGKEYKELAQYDWTLKTLLYYFHQRPNTLLNAKNDDFNSFFPLINNADKGHTDFISMRRANLTIADILALHNNDTDTIKKSEHFRLIKNTVIDELAAMQEAKRILFKLDENGSAIPDENNKDKFIINPDVLNGKIQTQLYYHYTLNKDGSRNYHNGNVFKFFNLISEFKNTQTTLNDFRLFNSDDVELTFFEHLMYSPNIDTLLKMPIGTKRSDATEESPIKKNDTFGNLLDRFVVNYMINTAANTVRHLSPYQEYLENSKIQDNRNEEISYNLLGNKQFAHAVIEFAYNTYLANIEQYRFFHGSLADYKSRIDANKRAAQVINSGISCNLKDTFKSVTISDIKLKSKVYNEMINTYANQITTKSDSTIFDEKGKVLSSVIKRLEVIGNEKNLKNPIEKNIYDAVSPYLTNDSANAVSLVIFDEFVKRISGFGKYEQYKDIINKIQNHVELDREDYTRFAAMQKNFYYDFRYNDELRKFVPNQVKNAEVILTPDLVKNLQLERLVTAMQSAGISQINLESAEKIGTFSVVNISDNNGDLIQDDNLLHDLLNNNKRDYYYENLKMQQETTDHVIDEVNKKGVQISKKIFDNVDDSQIYNVRGIKFTGADLKEHCFMLDSSNIEESASDVMSEFNVLLDENGTIKNDIDINILSSKLVERAIERGLIKNNVFGLLINPNSGKFNIPLFNSTTSETWQNLLTAMFSNDVTAQKFPGIHAPQMSSIFMSHDTKLGKVSDNLQSKLTDTTGINYRKDFAYEGRKDLKLSSRVLNTSENETTKVIEAEVLVSRWSKLFYNEDGSERDINEITNDDVLKMIGYRIPTESKYSIYSFKVVGFLPDSNGSAIVLPDDFITQTGSDFDIDTVYTMLYNLKKDENNNIVPVEYIDFLKKENVDSRINATLKNSKHLKYVLSKIVTNNDELTTIISKLNDFTYDFIKFKKYTERDDVKQVMQQISDLKDSKHDLSKKEKDIIDYKINDLSYIFTDADFYEYENSKSEYKSFIDSLKTKIKNYYINNRKSIEFQNTKEARQNRTLDNYLSIINNPVHYAECIVGATYSDISQSKNILDALSTSKDKSKIINEHYDSNTIFSSSKKEVIDNLTYKGQQRLRELAMAGRELKEITIAMNGFISIAQTTKMHISDSLAPELIYRITDADQQRHLVQNFKAQIYTENDIKYARVKLSNIGNNANNTFTNTVGKKVTAYFAQIPTNVLDNVKDPLPDNVSGYTIGVWALLPILGGDFNTATLFINQPIIKDVIAYYNENANDIRKKGREIEDTKRNYQTLLYKVKRKISNENKSDLWEKNISNDGLLFVDGRPDFQERAYFNLGYKNNTSVPLLFDTLANSINFTSENEINELTKDDAPINETRLKELQNYLVYQLQILETYKNYDKVADVIAKTSNVLNADKIGAGPTFETTNRLLTNIQNTASDNTILIDNESAITKIYPNLFNKSEDSVYPSMQTALEYSNLLSVAAFSKMFIDQSNIYRIFKQQLLSSLRGDEYDSKLINSFTKYCNTLLLNDHPWLNSLSQTEINTLLGKTEDNKRPNLVLDFKFDSVPTFISLSLANQIMLIKERKGEVKNNILNYLETKTKDDDFKRNGCYKVNYKNNDVADDVVRSFNELWYSDDIYERILARNLVRYEYLMNGFAYGFSSYAKVIPTAIRSKNTDSFNNEDYSESGIGESDHLYNKLDIANRLVIGDDSYNEDLTNAVSTLFNCDVFDRFIRSNWENSSIIPDASKITETGAKIRVFQPINGIISVNYNKFGTIQSSKYWEKIKNSDYIKLSHEKGDGSIYVIYKRDNSHVKFENTGEDADSPMIGTGTVYYYPVAKLELGEHTEFSNIQSNNLLSTGKLMKSQEEYLAEIDQLNEQKKYSNLIYSDELSMGKNSIINDELKKDYKTQEELIISGNKTAITILPKSKFSNVKIGDIIKIEGIDGYIKVTKAPYTLQLYKNYLERKEWSKLEGLSIENLRKKDSRGQTFEERKDLMQFQFEYIGILDDITKKYNIDNNIDTQPSDSSISHSTNINEQTKQTLNDSDDLQIKCK